MFLAAYDYQLLQWLCKALGHTDALSYYPFPALVEDPTSTSLVLLIEDLPTAPVSAVEVVPQLAKDRTITQILNRL